MPIITDDLSSALKDKVIVFVGMMASGKSAIGRRLAATLDLPFYDADHEIEVAANMKISEIFASYGEQEFRKGEKRVIKRLLGEKPSILATGGGAFMDPDTRNVIKENAISIWLKVDADRIIERAKKKNTRPLLQVENPEKVIHELLEIREPIYAEADITVASGHKSHSEMVEKVTQSLYEYLDQPT